MKNKELTVIKEEADVLIIGGGTAGCYAAITLARNSDLKIVIAEKANIKRSGCLAAGVNAINAYITKNRKPSDYADYAMNDADGIARYDLLLSMSEGLNDVTKDLENMGLVILKDENGEYVARGNRNIKINGENIKPILAEEVKKYPNIEVINHLNITDFLLSDENEETRILGAAGFDVDEEKAYVIRAENVLVTTGGASGIYKPNNPGFSRHKMWYPPFNTGAGYAMGIRAGAEMTTFEMRFIALRCKDTIAPTGTIAQGVGAKQVNSLGEIYEDKYGLRTSERVYGTVKENLDGKGPCYLDTTKITETQENELFKAYLNMAPSQTLRWIESGAGPRKKAVEIEGTEPYIVGGHTASGYWVDNKRRTTLKGLYAAGDVAGGAPQKYVTGALVEGEIAALTILGDRELGIEQSAIDENTETLTEQENQIVASYAAHLNRGEGGIAEIEALEAEMQSVMDEYAGGISTGYAYTEESLHQAGDKLKALKESCEKLSADNMDDLLMIYEIRERLTVAETVLEHLLGRKETRWHSFAENRSYPEKDERFEMYVNTVKNKDEKTSLIYRKLVGPKDPQIDFLKEGIWKKRCRNEY